MSRYTLPPMKATRGCSIRTDMLEFGCLIAAPVESSLISSRHETHAGNDYTIDGQQEAGNPPQIGRMGTVHNYKSWVSSLSILRIMTMR
jgi:hypothetical protein